MAKASASTTNTLSMFINLNSGVVINGGPSNGGANVILNKANIKAYTGIIHVVDHVIGPPSIVHHSLSNPSFSTLVSTLTSEGQLDFVSILSETGPFTVFAPTNEAFLSLSSELAALNFTSSSTQLTTALQYHVISPTDVLSTLFTNEMPVTPLAGGTFTINTANGATITDGSGRVTNTISTNVQATNGVIHAVDKVLLPNLAD